MDCVPEGPTARSPYSSNKSWGWQPGYYTYINETRYCNYYELQTTLHLPSSLPHLTPSQLHLEEQQRTRRHKREAAATKAAQAVANGNHEEAARFEKEATYTPRWFKKEFDPLTQTMMHVYKGGYWEAKLRGDWSGLPNIF